MSTVYKTPGLSASFSEKRLEDIAYTLSFPYVFESLLLESLRLGPHYAGTYSEQYSACLAKGFQGSGCSSPNCGRCQHNLQDARSGPEDIASIVARKTCLRNPQRGVAVGDGHYISVEASMLIVAISNTCPEQAPCDLQDGILTSLVILHVLVIYGIW